MNLHEQTTIRAANNAKFYSRFKWLGLGAFAFGLWSVYDGAVTYPDQQVRAQALLEVAQEHLSDEELAKCAGAHDHTEQYQTAKALLLEDETGQAAWLELAKEKEWPEAPPTKPRSDGDIAGQYVMAGLCALATIYFFYVLLKTTGRWMELDGDRLHTSGGLSFLISSVTEIEKRQWIDKGIAQLRYDDHGRSRRFVVDNYKYLREETDAILYRIEQLAGADKITGGPAEELPTDQASIDSGETMAETAAIS